MPTIRRITDNFVQVTLYFTDFEFVFSTDRDVSERIAKVENAFKGIHKYNQVPHSLRLKLAYSVSSGEFWLKDPLRRA